MQYSDYERITQLEARVSHLEAVVESLMMRQGWSAAEIPAEESPQTLAIRQAVQSGNKIHAIKLYRQLYGVGLKEAKDAIDAM